MFEGDALSDNKRIGDGLRKAHAQWAKSNELPPRLIRLPADRQIQFFKSGLDANIHMSPEAVSSNMQTNAAGFEGWALALKLWLGFRDITLHWTPPARLDGQALDRHYARFLYRVQRFEELFPDWFRVGTRELLDDCVVRGGADLFLNIAGANSTKSQSMKGESEIEWSLVEEHSPALSAAFNLRKLDRQFPVGLYRQANLKLPVFTGGTSAIDLVGVGDGEFTIFELKDRDNIMVGALSELLFYAAVIRDAVSTRFQFGGRIRPVSRSKIGPEDVKAATSVRAVLIAPNFHPLLEHPDLIATLNKAARRQSDMIPLSFERCVLKDWGSPTGPQFERIAA